MKSLNCKTAMGEITVLDNHRPLITMLKKGKMKVVDHKNKEHVIETVSGFLEVKRDNLRSERSILLNDSCGSFHGDSRNRVPRGRAHDGIAEVVY